MDILKQIDWQKSPLLPAIAQDFETDEVLMLAYMDKESLTLTLESGLAHYFSRTKQRIWKKGEESGNIQKIKELYLDCDGDTILLKIEQVGGAACHTGRRSCFFNKIEGGESEIIGERLFNPDTKYSAIDSLFHTIESRKGADKESSYTASLFAKGENTILKKIVEESGEFCFAVKDNNEREIIYEAADLLYHTLVALSYKGISPDRVKQEITRRFGVSGIEEKSSRTK